MTVPRLLRIRAPPSHFSLCPLWCTFQTNEPQRHRDHRGGKPDESRARRGSLTPPQPPTEGLPHAAPRFDF
jgi:hypothetical protein